MGDPKNPKPGEFVVDASEVEQFAVDVEPGDLQGKRTEGEGNAEVMAEIEANQPLYGEAVGITLTIFTMLMTAQGRIAICDKFIQALQKLLEVILETRALEVDKRERILYAIAEGVDRHSKLPGNEAMPARYHRTRVYRSRTGNKAALTRHRNEEAAAAKAAAEKAAAGTSTTTTTSGTTPPKP